VNAANDLRLSWGSPCIDAASTAPPTGTLDLVRHARDVDGDLDTAEVCDLGAFEFRPLEVVGPLTLGSLIQWELRGPGRSDVCLVLVSPSARGLAHFGSVRPVRSARADQRLPLTTIGPNSLTTLQRSIPNSPLLVGQTFSFQALIDNALAPNGKPSPTRCRSRSCRRAKRPAVGGNAGCERTRVAAEKVDLVASMAGRSRRECIPRASSTGSPDARGFNQSAGRAVVTARS
jgi:hypothetical protein